MFSDSAQHAILSRYLLKRYQHEYCNKYLSSKLKRDRSAYQCGDTDVQRDPIQPVFKRAGEGQS